MNARDFLGWWVRQISDLLPVRTRRAEGAAGGYQVEYRSDVVIVRKSNEQENILQISCPSSRAEKPDAAWVFTQTAPALHDAMKEMVAVHGMNDAILYPGDDALLEREVTFPLPAERSLESILSYEMDRLTPFAATDVVFGWTVLRRDATAGRVHVRLSLVPLAALRGLPDLLRAVGIVPAAIEIPRPDSTRLRLPLTRRQPGGGRLRTAMLGACVVLAVVALVLPFARQAWQNAWLDRQMAALRPATDAAEQIRRNLTGGSTGRAMVRAERQRLGDPLAVLAALTDALPDGTYLTDLTLRQGQLLVSGRSPVSTRVIQAMSANPLFATPSFAAPVTRAEGSESSQFAIRAGITAR
ncbi:PilN domain-containing protein [Komagataeibacter kakiaceti]